MLAVVAMIPCTLWLLATSSLLLTAKLLKRFASFLWLLKSLRSRCLIISEIFSRMAVSDEAYRQAGVDLKSAEAVIGIAKNAAHSTKQPWLLGGIGGFSGAFEIPEGYKQPVMLCACDGVGTKLKLAFEANRHDS